MTNRQAQRAMARRRSFRYLRQVGTYPPEEIRPLAFRNPAAPVDRSAPCFARRHRVTTGLGPVRRI